ncbi:pyrroline-5-carboxylate reductase family protein [Paracoccus luteus]|uniref:pyrroline-5-carboxylate reductase family protein n=1 Tax=Paracoccus luteus TaxID=2508543 RepID=UPI00106F91A7|nr:pyrroline-5-carboxylate reductase dimerization domain-containing protein [Paracoccus luteus]
MRVGIIGATGWLGSALGAQLLGRGMVRPSDLVLANRSGPRADYHGHADVVWASDTDDLVVASDVVVVSVRPQDWPALRLHAPGRLVVSFMAGVSLDQLAACGGRIVRAMPNAAAEIGRSYSPWMAGPAVTDQDRATVAWLLSAIGTEDELADERQIALMTAVPGSGAAYPALMAVALADFLRGEGVADAIAWRAAEAVVCDGGQLLQGRIADAPALVAAYLDYAGTTAAGIDAARAAGFDASIRRAMQAATDAAIRMAAGSDEG